MKYALYKPEGMCNDSCARQLCEAYNTMLPRVYSDEDLQALSSVM